MKIAPEKYYRCRCGCVIGPLYINARNSDFSYSVPGWSIQFNEDGLSSESKYDDSFDLIEEVAVSFPYTAVPDKRDTAGLYSITIEVPRNLIGSVRIVALEDDKP